MLGMQQREWTVDHDADKTGGGVSASRKTMAFSIGVMMKIIDARF
jgi:hypothetical protein